MSVPYEQLLCQNAMIGEDIRSRAMLTMERVYELQAIIQDHQHIVTHKDRELSKRQSRLEGLT